MFHNKLPNVNTAPYGTALQEGKNGAAMSEAAADRAGPAAHGPDRAGGRPGERQWIEAALRHLADANVDDIRIEELAREIGVSKGSFYWHFRNRDHLLDRVLEHWMDRATVQVTRWARAGGEKGVERLFRLLALPAMTPPSKRGAEAELAVRSWARRDARAAETVRRVDRMRFDFFVELMGEMGHQGEQAHRRAAIAQAFMLGEALLRSGGDGEDRLSAVRACTEMLAGSQQHYSA